MKHKKILILGSGALKIGEAGEFDYSGSQAIKALKEEGIETVLINPNIATIQTSKKLADKVYFLPVNSHFAEKVIQKEKPTAIFLSFGGQTALNCGVDLYRKGVLDKYGVEVLGTPVSSIILSEDREAFARRLRSMHIPTPESKLAKDKKEALKIAKDLGYPVMVRGGFALGGQGSGIAANQDELLKILDIAFSFTKNILVEKYLHHFKEVEYEIVRDKFDNCIAVCNMENMDPLGIHTGESIVVAPSQTLPNNEYHLLRSTAIEIVRSLGIVGECNVQFALNPKPKDGLEYYVIELNARLSRSSALASKATGYPLAYVAAKLALGQNLTQLKNKVTGVTQACFEPALDYITVKIPRWDLNKFKGAEMEIGSGMKSVGEVMGIGRTFEEAYQKAIRMLDLDIEGAVNERIANRRNYKDLISKPTPDRIFGISEGLKRGLSVKKIYEKTGIDPWFLNRIKNITDHETSLSRNKKIDRKSLLNLKQIGFSDKRIGQLVGQTGLYVRSLRKRFKVLPSVLQIDTLAGEFPAKTNYLYLSYNAFHHDSQPTGQKGVIVLGSGPYRIGSSVEFDWTSVNTVNALKKNNKYSIIINCNPETVSTDYDISDKLYFEELTFERIADIYEFEKANGIIVSVGGQTPNNRAMSLSNYGFKILGTSAKDIERAENRNKFSDLLDHLSIEQPSWNKFSKLAEAIEFSNRVGYPVLARPSFVLSGSNMRICYNEEDLARYAKETLEVSKEYPITISKFIENAKEIEVDAIAQNGTVKGYIFSDHIENAGVHSGDATISFPPQELYIQTLRKLKIITFEIAKNLNITGPFNIQAIAKDNKVYVIEVNLRSSRTFPFISKVTGIDFVGMFVDSLFKKNVGKIKIDLTDYDFVATKVAQFSFSRVKGADPVLDVEMASTGEVACFGDDLEESFLKGMLSVGAVYPKKGIFVSLGGDSNKLKFTNSIPDLIKLGLPIYATEKTTKFLKKYGINANKLYKIHEGKSPNVLTVFQEGKVDLAINLTDQSFKKDINDDYAIRRSAVDHNITLFTNDKKAELFLRSVAKYSQEELTVKEWSEYTTT